MAPAAAAASEAAAAAPEAAAPEAAAPGGWLLFLARFVIASLTCVASIVFLSVGGGPQISNGHQSGHHPSGELSGQKVRPNESNPATIQPDECAHPQEQQERGGKGHGSWVSCRLCHSRWEAVGITCAGRPSASLPHPEPEGPESPRLPYDARPWGGLSSGWQADGVLPVVTCRCGTPGIVNCAMCNVFVGMEANLRARGIKQPGQPRLPALLPGHGGCSGDQPSAGSGPLCNCKCPTAPRKARKPGITQLRCATCNFFIGGTERPSGHGPLAAQCPAPGTWPRLRGPRRPPYSEWPRGFCSNLNALGDRHEWGGCVHCMCDPCRHCGSGRHSEERCPVRPADRGTSTPNEDEH